MDKGAPEQERQITAELASLSRSVSSLTENVIALQERLSPVLRQSEPSTATETAPQPSICEVADAIADSRRKVEDITFSVRDAMERLEV